MQHLEEGTIHAWIDGALSPVEAREVEAHLVTCEACSELVAEARGLVAASSRILTALDDVPGDVIPITTPVAAPSNVTPIQSARRPWYTPMWVRTAAAIAVVAGTSALVMTAKLNSPERKSAMLAPDSAQVASLPEVASDSLSTSAAALPSAAPVAPPVASQRGTDLASAGSATSSAANRVSDARIATASPLSGSTVGGAVAVRPGSRTETPAAPAVEQTLADRASVAREEARVQQSADAARRSETSELASQRVVESTPTVASSVPALHADTGGLANRPSSTAIIGKVLSRAAGKGAAKATSAPTGAAASAQTFSAPAAMTSARGCYAIAMSPWSGGSIPFGSPPPKIELDTIRSQAGDLLVHPGRGAASNGATRAFWTQQGDSVYITWENDARGVRLSLPTYGEVLRGRAETIAPSRGVPTQTSDVEARRISCRE